jgi:hypothetical protein
MEIFFQIFVAFSDNFGSYLSHKFVYDVTKIVSNV